MKRIRSALFQIYPPWLLLLAWAPWLAGVAIRFPLSDSRQLAIALAWIPLFTLPALWLRRPMVYRLACILFFLMGLVEIIHWVILQGPLSTTSLLVIANTNLDESIDFIQLKSGMGLLIVLPYIWIFIRALRSTISYQKTKHLTRISLLVLTFSLLFIGENILHHRFFRKGVPHTVKVARQLVNQIQTYRDFLKKVRPKKVQATSALPEPCTLVLVIGESANRNHMSLYGYSRKTTPRLDKRRDIAVFTDAVAPYSNTMSSVLAMLSSSNLDNRQPVNRTVDIIDVLHSAGFKTFWLSNQPPVGVWDNMVSAMGRKSDVVRFINTSSSSSFEATNQAAYDENLLVPLQKALGDTAGKKFIVLHLMGSHTAYAKRYPGAFSHFSGHNSKAHLIAQYDNSILYNDYVVDRVFSVLSGYAARHPGEEVLAMYLSDHGENVYDEGDRVGHDYSGVLPRCNVEIPLLLWTPEGRDFLYGRISDSIRRRPVVTDDLFHALIDLSRVKTPFFVPERSFVHPGFDIHRKRILEDGKDYDAR